MKMTIQDMNEGVRDFFREFHKYTYSGVCDSEGMTAVALWVQRKVTNAPAKRITFKYLEGYTSYDPKKRQREHFLAKGEMVEYPTKRQIAGAISKAATKLAKVMAQATRAGIVSPNDVFSTLRY
jgi:hypothetical protein